MSEAPEKKAKKDTGSKPRPKRDPNQPLPKAKPGAGGRLVKLLVGAALVLVVAFVGLYSLQIGRPPWEWSAEDQTGFVDFSKKQVDEAVDRVDWEALKGQITEKTKQLWDQVPEWEAKLDKRLADLAGQRQGAAPAAPASGTDPKAPARPATAGGPPPAAASGAPPATAATPPAAPAAPTALEEGCGALRDAIRLYRGSMQDQGRLRAAKAKFQQAAGHLEKAHAEAEARGDQVAVEEIEGYLMQCNTYLEDCSKRQTLR